MILRKLADALRRQDWFVVLLELLIVVFGVYIGIYLGDIQAARQYAIETDQALAALESELRSDITRLDQVIALQTNRIRDQQELLQIWSNYDDQGEEVAARLESVFGDNSTFFPNRSAYSSMQAGGYLARLPDETLRLNITRLFEREYVRQDLNATLYDELSNDYSILILADHWDRLNQQPLGDHADSLATLRNGIISVRNQGEFYFALITEQIRPDILKVLEMVDAYQKEREG